MTRGEAYWVVFEPALGGDTRKRRPAVIVSNDSSNRGMARVQVVPLATSTRAISASQALVPVNGRPRKATAYQIRTVAKERLTGPLGDLGAH